MIEKNKKRFEIGFVGSNFDPYQFNNKDVVGRLHLYQFQLTKIIEYLHTAKEIKKIKDSLEIGVDVKLRWLYKIARESLHKSAVVSLASIYNTGYEDKEKIAKNDKIFRKKYLNTIVQKALPVKEDFEKFENQLKEIIYLRDKMIGHGDGDSRDLLQEDIGQISMIDESGLLESIDFVFIGKAVSKISLSINDFLLGKFKI